MEAGFALPLAVKNLAMVAFYLIGQIDEVRDDKGEVVEGDPAESVKRMFISAIEAGQKAAATLDEPCGCPECVERRKKAH